MESATASLERAIKLFLLFEFWQIAFRPFTRYNYAGSIPKIFLYDPYVRNGECGNLFLQCVGNGNVIVRNYSEPVILGNNFQWKR